MTDNRLELISYFSDMNAPVEYYITFMLPKNKRGLFILEDEGMLSIINKHLCAISGGKTPYIFYGENASKEYFTKLQESYKTNTSYDEIVKNKTVKNFSWKFVNKNMFRIDEVKDGDWSVLSLFINPSFTYETTIKHIRDLSMELAKFARVSVKVDSRIIGEDSVENVRSRTIRCLNEHYKTNNKKLLDFTEEQISRFYFHYDCKDLEMQHNILGDPITTENITSKLDTQYLDSISSQRVQTIASQHLPPIMHLHSFIINELGRIEKRNEYMRPSQLIDFGLDWVGYTPVEKVNPTRIYRMLQEMFYEITRKDIYEDDQKHLIELQTTLEQKYSDIVVEEDLQGKQDLEKDIIAYTERIKTQQEHMASNPIIYRRYFVEVV